MSGAGVSTVEAFEPFGSFAQRSIWTNVRFQRREEEITITITEMNRAVTFERVV